MYGIGSGFRIYREKIVHQKENDTTTENPGIVWIKLFASSFGHGSTAKYVSFVKSQHIVAERVQGEWKETNSRRT